MNWGVAKAIMITIGILCLGVLMIPILVIFSFWESYFEPVERLERQERKRLRKEGSSGKGLYIRY